MRKKITSKKKYGNQLGVRSEHIRLNWQDDSWKDLLPEELIYLNRKERRFLAAKKRKEDRKNK